MRLALLSITAIAVGLSFVGSADAEQTKRLVVRSGNGTVIQPTRTIIHNSDGTTTVITVPRRSYLDTGTEVSVGDRSFQDYAFPPAGDPGRPNWYYGPAVNGVGGRPFAQPFYLPGYNPYTPF